MRAGRQRGLVGITFDDGYVSVLEAAAARAGPPRLRRPRVYIISGRLGGTNEWDEGPSWPLLSASQVRELAAAGHGDRLARRHAHPAGRAVGRGQLHGGGRREPGEPGRARSARRSAASPTRTARWTPAARQRGARGGLRLRVRRGDARWPSSGSWRCPGSTSASATTPARMAAKRLLYRGYIAAQRETRMKVLHVITGLDVGGAELQLAMMLQHTRHDADVVTLYNPGPVADRIRAAGDLACATSGCSATPSCRALLRLRSIIAEGRYDVVHTHLYRAQIYARPAARLAGDAGGADHRALDRRDAHRAAQDDRRGARRCTWPRSCSPTPPSRSPTSSGNGSCAGACPRGRSP